MQATKTLVAGAGMLLSVLLTIGGTAVAQEASQGAVAPPRAEISAPPELSIADRIAEAQAHSLTLSEQQRARALEIFSTGFALWQAGEWGASEQAFQEGLRIDPANAAANFYYGDILKRRGDHASAFIAYSISSAAAGIAPETFRARSELANMVVTEDWLLGRWHIRWEDVAGEVTFSREGEQLVATIRATGVRYSVVERSVVRVQGVQVSLAQAQIVTGGARWWADSFELRRDGDRLIGTSLDASGSRGDATLTR